MLEVSHHGSADPRLARLLAQLRPRLAVISVGARNAYGHPAATTLAALARAGVPVRRTDREGDIALGCEPAGDADTITAMSAAPLDPVYLIGGSDRPKVELASAACARACAPRTAASRSSRRVAPTTTARA